MKARIRRFSGKILSILSIFAFLLVSMNVNAFAVGELTKAGLVEYIGAQKKIFTTGDLNGTIDFKFFKGKKHLYCVGPAAGLDGEVTIWDSKPYVAKVRNNRIIVDHTFNNKGLFLVWAQVPHWRSIPIPSNVKTYVQLQRFVEEQALLSGIDITEPFPFQVIGTPVEIKGHVNVNKIYGIRPITKKLFVRSKKFLVLRHQPVYIIGFYSTKHYGIFISAYAPAIKRGSGIKNAVHMHFIAPKIGLAGHIDNIILGKGMVLRLPRE